MNIKILFASICLMGLSFDARATSGYQVVGEATPSVPCFTEMRGNRLRSHYLIPDEVEERGLRLLTENEKIDSKRQPPVFCTGPAKMIYSPLEALKKRTLRSSGTTLWISKDGNSIYQFNVESNSLILTWSKLSEPTDPQEIWFDHIHQIVWGDRIVNGDFYPIKLSLKEATKEAELYSTREFPAGSWTLPAYEHAASSAKLGMAYILPGFTERDPEQWDGDQSYRNYYLLKSLKGDEDEHTYMRFVSGSGLGIVPLRSIFGAKDKYVRFILKAEAVKAFVRNKK